jgi:hypothetical protein
MGFGLNPIELIVVGVFALTQILLTVLLVTWLVKRLSKKD